MLYRPIHQRSLGALLGGEPAAAVLYRYLVELSQTGAPNIKMKDFRRDLAVAIQQDIDQRTGNALRFNETSAAVASLLDTSLLEIPDIPQLDVAFDAVLHFGSAGEVHFRDIHVLQYAQTLAELDPAVLVAWRLVRWCNAVGNNRRAILSKAVDGLDTLFVATRFNAAPFADNHTHLTGITGNEFVLNQIILGQPVPGAQAEHKDVLQRVRRIRRILQSLTELWSANDVLDKGKTNAWAKNVLQTIPDGDKEATPDAYVDWDTLVNGISVSGNDQSRIGCRWLVFMLADCASKSQFEYAWIWLLIALWQTYRQEKISTTARAVILFMIADMMALRRQLMMDGSGLRRFTTRYFSSTLRDVAKQRTHWEPRASRDIARRLFARRGDKAAIKVGLDTLHNPWLPALASNANAIIRAHENDASLTHKRSREFWQLCAHFNRVTEEQSRSRLWELAKDLRDTLYSEVTLPLSKPASEDDIAAVFAVFPSEIIRGLDVVGDETRWPIERFAPMLRWLRSAEAAPAAPLCLPFGLGPTRPAPRLHFSIHAGEDYAHPLSGLRHVAETVDFCAMNSGDRLGHALALGIAPDQWLQRHGDVVLSVDEHVDNLVWAWYEATQLSHLAEATRVIPRLKSRIARLLAHVSWYPSARLRLPLTDRHLMHLHEAWSMRMNCPYQSLHQPGNTAIETPELLVGAPDWSRIRAVKETASTNTAEGLYVLRASNEAARLMGENKPISQVRIAVPRHGHITRRQRELEQGDADEINAALGQASTGLHDHDDANDLTFMLALQDVCIERYAQRGLSIETNPSSNVYIGQLQTYSDHPIYRWDPPNQTDLNKGEQFNRFGLRNEPILVTINTDDPGMIPTTLRMEHHLMHEAAIDRGYTVQEADAWIEKLRKLNL